MVWQKLSRLLIIATTTSSLLLLTSGIVFSEDGATNWTQNPLLSSRIKVLLTTPYGIFAGEYDSRATSPPPYNGVFLSTDLGKSWEQKGLNTKGVTSLAYKEQTIFAGTFVTNSTPSGVYKSEDFGKSWVHTGLNYPILSLAVSREALLAGTASRGIFRSGDNGTTWQQVVGSGFGPSIKSLAAFEDTLVAASDKNVVYLSNDSGITWSEIPPLKDLVTGHLFINGEVIIAGTSNGSGMFRSTDGGTVWSKVESWGNKSTGPFTQIDGVVYSGGYSETHSTFGVFKSSDNGLTWHDISYGLNDGNANIAAISAIYSKPDKIFISATAKGVFEHEVPTSASEIKPFLDLPWLYKSFGRSAQNIYSFFDHEYPLLGYPHLMESRAESGTTLNYLGIKKPVPQMYYSSHNGVDFPLPFGTTITAPADGYASYSYTSGGGHTIKIDHGNGLQTWYLHLQSKGLAMSQPNIPVSVSKGDQIGLVGLSGNTTGPHLHLSVLRDKNNNNKFDDFPDGLIDPYGWDAGARADPWEIFGWDDALGAHSGSKSYYLWIHKLSGTNSILNPSLASLMYSNKRIDIPKGSTEFSGIIEFKDIPLTFGYGGDGPLLVENTSFRLFAFDPTGSELSELKNDSTLSINYSESDISRIEEDSIKLYRISRETQEWEEVPSALNKETKVITAQTRLLGDFAAFGLPKDTAAPTTSHQILGDFEDGVYTSDVLIVLGAQDNENGLGIDSIFYSLDSGENWEEYEEPLSFNENGSFEVRYKSLDKAGNMESEKSVVFTVQKNGWNKKVFIIKAQFDTGGW